MLPEQLTYGTVLIAKPGKIIVHPGNFAVAPKYTQYVIIGKGSVANSTTRRIIDEEVSFSQDGINWSEPCFRPVTWLIENYMQIPYEPVYRNRLEEVDQ